MAECRCVEEACRMSGSAVLHGYQRQADYKVLHRGKYSISGSVNLHREVRSEGQLRKVGMMIWAIWLTVAFILGGSAGLLAFALVRMSGGLAPQSFDVPDLNGMFGTASAQVRFGTPHGS
jgi:hypothetical protein